MTSRFATLEQKARQLMDTHGLTDWVLVWDNAKTRFGQCRYKSKTISLSKRLSELNDDHKFTDTVLHEIAHAITYKRTGRGGHGNHWKLVCMEIGAQPHRCYGAETVTPRGRFVYQCPNCMTEVTRHKRILRRRIACGKCCNAHNGGRFSEQYILEPKI